MSDVNTKEKILDAAEKLFVDNGFAATSLRAIIKEADVNTAAVHYHFGSKEGLIVAVLERSVAELNRERLDRLDVLESEYGDRAVPLEDVIRTFLDPVMKRHCAGGDEGVIPRLMGRAITEPAPSKVGVLRGAFAEVAIRFSGAIGRAMPGLDRGEVEWRLHMMVGAMVFTVIAPRIHPGEGRRQAWSNNPDELTGRLVSFLVAGLKAPMPESAGKESK